MQFSIPETNVTVYLKRGAWGDKPQMNPFYKYLRKSNDEGSEEDTGKSYL